VTTLAQLIDEVIHQRAPYEAQITTTMRGRARPPMRAPTVDLPRVKAFEQQQALAAQQSGPEATARDISAGAMALPRTIRPGYTPTQQLVSDATEFTGLPQIAHGIGHVREALAAPRIDERGTAAIGDAIGDFASGGVNLAMLGAGMPGEGRVAAELPRVRAPVPGEFPDGFLPFPGVPTGARPRTPFRSTAATSQDLREAAAPHSAGSDGGPFALRNAHNVGSDVEQLRGDGFNVDQPLYRGMTRPAANGSIARNPSLQGSEQFNGTSFSKSRAEANIYASEGGGGVVYQAFMRGQLEDGPTYMRQVQQRAKQLGVTHREAALQIQQEYAQRGITGVEWPPNQYGKGGEVRVFDETNHVRAPVSDTAHTLRRSADLQTQRAMRPSPPPRK